MRVHISQNNYRVGDLDFNLNIIEKEYLRSCKKESDLIVFSELAITGYSPQDLLQKEYFLKDAKDKIDKIVKMTSYESCAILIGTPILKEGSLYNGALFIENGQIKQEFLKNNLPNYKPFDEKRHFESSTDIEYFELNGSKISVLICEDVWDGRNISKIEPHESDLMIAINASPFSPDKLEQRFLTCREFCQQLNLPLIYVNQVGGVDSLVFDGKSFVMNKDGEVVRRLNGFASDSEVIYFDKNMEILHNKDIYGDDLLSDLYNGSVLALRDYVSKTGFEKVLIGMSGGIDSALVAQIAVDALGSENVRLIALPTRFNSSQSFDDAKTCAKNLDVDLQVIEIDDIFRISLDVLAPHFEDKKVDTTEENLQSRIRGMILMAMSNKFNELLITTGNKSEMAVGYATIYGDMNGAFNPIKDLYKTQVFDLAKWRNDNVSDISVYKKKDLIPGSIIEKEPSAELSFDQKDSDSLPDYEVLDEILYKIIEEEKSIEQVIAETEFDIDLIKRIAKLFYQSEYKRQQAVIGPKLSKMSFDKDRRYLISSGYSK